MALHASVKRSRYMDSLALDTPCTVNVEAASGMH